MTLSLNVQFAGEEMFLGLLEIDENEMETKPKGEASAKGKSCFLDSLMEMLTIQIQMQGC